MLIKEHVNTPAKRMGLVSVVLSGVLFLTIAFIWNIKHEPFIYREEIQPIEISVRIEPVLKDEPNQPIPKDVKTDNQGLFHVNRDDMEPYGHVYLDRQCYNTENVGSWINLSKEQQDAVMGKCSAHKFGRHYQWKTSFSDFFRSTIKNTFFYIVLFFFLGGAFLILGIPQRLALWIQKGK